MPFAECAQVNPPQVSVILPSYNEAMNVVPLIRAIKRQLRVPHEIVLVDDHSPDGTGDVAREAFADDLSVTVHIRTEDRGLATAIREGIERSRGPKVLVMLTDFNHDPELVGRLIDETDHAEMIIGSRFCPGGGMANPWRYVCSLLYSCWFVRPVLRTGVRDNLCGYYLIRRQLLQRLPLDEIFYGYGDYFFRLIWHVRAAGGSILEIPAYYRPRSSGKSKSNLPAMLIRYTGEVVKLLPRAWSPQCRQVVG